MSAAYAFAALPPLSLPRLFRLHVLLMAPMLPFGTAAVTSLRARSAPPPPGPRPPPAERKQRVKTLVKLHFLLSALALYAATAGLAAIFLHKQRLGRAHFASVHSWAGGLTLLLWLSAYLSAQPNVWADVIKQRRLVYAPKWLWSSKLHRNLGLLAYTCSLVAVLSALAKPISISLLGASGVRVAALLTAGLGGAMMHHKAWRVARRLPVRVWATLLRSNLVTPTRDGTTPHTHTTQS